MMGLPLSMPVSYPHVYSAICVKVQGGGGVVSQGGVCIHLSQ